MTCGQTRTLGNVLVDLTVGSNTQHVCAHVIRGFKYHLHLCTDIGKLFPIHIDLQKRTAVLKPILRTEPKPTFKCELKPQQQQSSTYSSTTNLNRPHPSPECQHLLISNSSPQSSNDSSINSILSKFAKLFAKNSTDLGRIDTEKHHIRLINDKPIALRPYRQSVTEINETQRQVKQSLKKRVDP